MAARAQAYLFIAAGAVGSLGVLLPHPERFDAAGLLAIQGASFAAALCLLILGARTPDWVATCGPFGAAVLTSLAIVLTGTSTSAYLLFYMWVAFYAFYFLSRRQAVVLACSPSSTTRRWCSAPGCSATRRRASTPTRTSPPSC